MYNLHQDKLLIASHNEGKISEFRELLGLLKIDISSSRELKLPEPVEDGLTFEENALIKAKSASDYSNLISLSDDSGIEIDKIEDDDELLAKIRSNIDKLAAIMEEGSPQEDLPEYDEERVYLSDIKKVIHWYNIMQSVDLIKIPKKKKEKKQKDDEI